jgi:hypothetical protein
MKNGSAIEKEILFLGGTPSTSHRNDRINQLKFIKLVYDDMKNPLKFTLTSKFSRINDLVKQYRELLHRINTKILNTSYTKHNNKVKDLAFYEGIEGNVSEIIRTVKNKRINETLLHIHGTIDLNDKPPLKIKEFMSKQWLKLSGCSVDFSDYETMNEYDKWVLYSSKYGGQIL